MPVTSYPAKRFSLGFPLGWLLARAPQTAPVPGVRTVAQAEQNAEVIRLGPLGPDAMAEIAKLEI